MIIAPSLLAADLGYLADEIKKITAAKADWIHLDIMDGHFVPNLSFGPDFLKLIKKHTHLPCDVHLMCSSPEIILDHFLEAGADNITLHAELGKKAHTLIEKIRGSGCLAGISINPPTPFEEAIPFLSEIDLLLIMTVNPGYGGQKFISENISKLKMAKKKKKLNKKKFILEVDGGINFESMKECVKAGADALVSGTTIFRSENYKEAIHKMRLIAQDVCKIDLQK